MAAGNRPGGLTALAVLNFIFGGLGVVLSLLGLAGAAAVAKMASAAGGNVNVGAIYAALAISILSGILLIVAGVGYLGQKKFLGRTLGSVYGVLALIGTVVSLVMGPGGFGFGTIIGLIYPLLTLFMVNVTYKANLVN